jgi:hypothetical protein
MHEAIANPHAWIAAADRLFTDEAVVDYLTQHPHHSVCPIAGERLEGDPPGSNLAR